MKILLEQSIKATEILLKNHHVLTQWPEILIELKELYDEDLIKVGGLGLSAEDIVTRLIESGFRDRNVCVEEIIFLDEPGISGSVYQSLYEEKVKHKGEIWTIHKYDVDPFPSNPHAHNKESGLKLHLGNGDLYNRRKKVGSIRKKILLNIREKVKRNKLPPLDLSNK